MFGAVQATSHYLSQWWHSLLMDICVTQYQWVNTLALGQNGWHFADYIFKCIFLKGNVFYLIRILLEFVPKGSVDDKVVLAITQTSIDQDPWCRMLPLGQGVIVDLTPGNKFQWNFNQNTNIFIEENDFESVVCQLSGSHFVSLLMC